jgi:hypothetical protein
MWRAEVYRANMIPHQVLPHLLLRVVLLHKPAYELDLPTPYSAQPLSPPRLPSDRADDQRWSCLVTVVLDESYGGSPQV